MAYLVADRLSKIFRKPGGEELRAVDDVSLSLAENELLVLVGPSGCGKTTTLRLLAGLETPTSGSITLEGRDQTHLAPQERNVAMIFQHHALYPHLSAGENIAFGLKLRKLPAAEIQKRVGEATEMLHLNGCLDRMPAELSGGEQQRVALARALVRRPKVFLLDEPLSHLDTQLRARTRREIRSLQRRLGAAMIYVTHDQSEATAIGDRIAVMDRGRLLQVDPPSVIYDSPANLFTAQFIGNPQINVFAGSIILNAAGPTFRCETGSANANGLKDVALPVAVDAKFSAVKKVMLGLRPESVTIVPWQNAAGNGAWLGTVELVENWGMDSYVYLNCDSLKVVSRSTPRLAPSIGQQVDVKLDLSRALLFDAETGAAIR